MLNDRVKMNCYTYTPLTSPRSLRLLKLHPGYRHDALTGTIEVTELGKSLTEYVALSYVWGTRTADVEISVEDSVLQITENLAEALKRIRKVSEPQKVWIDQICIHQQDKVERAAQVHIMKYIFFGACEVIAWLGPDTHLLGPSAKFLITELAERGLNVAQCVFDECTRPPVHFPDDAMLERCSLPSRDSSLWQALRAFFQNDYFERMWTIQELRVSTSAILLWGDTTFNFFDLEIALVYSEFLQYSSDDSDFEGVPEISRALILRRAPRLTLLDMLQYSRDRKCSEPRDKIFAILGITAKESEGDSFEDDTTTDTYSKLICLASQPEIPIDYNMSVPDVFCRAARSIISSSNSLELLAVTERDLPDNELFKGLPSWVPHWHGRRMRIQNLAAFLYFDVSGGRKAVLGECLDHRVLSVYGMALSQITGTEDSIETGCLEDGNAEPQDSISKIWSYLQSIADRDDNDVRKVAALANSTPLADGDAFTMEDLPDCYSLSIQQRYHSLIIAFVWTLTLGHTSQVKGHAFTKCEIFQHLLGFIVWRFRFLWHSIDENLENRGQEDWGWASDRYLDSAIIAASVYLSNPSTFEGAEDPERQDAIMSMLPLMQIFYDQEGIKDSDALAALELATRSPNQADAYPGDLVYRGALSFFMTSSGHMGMGPQDIACGDEIVILLGARAPFVLRRVNDFDCCLIGECYIHGIMYGEAFDEASCEGAMRIFNLR